MAINAPVPVEGPLSMMKKLSANTYVYQPAGPAAAEDGRPSPRLVVVCSWMDARDLHIAKYIGGYQSLFPRAAIVLIRSRTDHFRWPRRAVAEIQAAVAPIRAAGCGSAEPRLLVHIFSSGGSSMLSRLYDAYRQQAGAALPAHVSVFDSTPGYFHYWRSVAAVNAGLRRWERVLCAPMVHSYITGYLVLTLLGGGGDHLRNFATAHNDQTKNGGEWRRTYIYSKDDKLVHWRDVEEHAREARLKGFDVRLERFHESQHVAHMRTDRKRYWRIVRDVWEADEDSSSPSEASFPEGKTAT